MNSTDNILTSEGKQKKNFKSFLKKMYDQYFLNCIDDYEEMIMNIPACNLCFTAFDTDNEFAKHIEDCYVKHKNRFKSELKRLKKLNIN